MFEVTLLPRAQEGLDSVPDEGKDAVEGALAQLEANPRPSTVWDCGEDKSGKYLYVGEKGKWKITYEIDDAGRKVYVHSIAERPSWAFDPR